MIAVKRLQAYAKHTLLIVLCAVTLSLSGCQVQLVPMPTASVSPTRARASVTPAPTLTNAPAIVYESVLTDKRVISLVLEGFTDDGSMGLILSALKQQNVFAAFFISGIISDEHPETVRNIADAGFVVGNYGLNAAKKMELNDIPTNMYQFRRGQELIAEVIGYKPTLFRCNGTIYTREVLQAAAAEGLVAGVKPNIFLNHKSFSTYEDALLFVQRLSRGSIISIKLGQVLDADEYGALTYNMNNRAIDPEPFLSDKMEDTIVETYANITNVVSWLLQALDAEGYVILSPEALVAEHITMFDDPAALSEELLALLDVSTYTVPVTQQSLDYLVTRTRTAQPQTDIAPDAAASSKDAAPAAPVSDVFVLGDSVIGGVADYMQWRRSTEPGYMARLRFFTSDSIVSGLATTTNDIPLTTSENNRVLESVADGITQQGAKIMLLMPGQADIRSHDQETLLAHLKLIIYRIRREKPDVPIWLLAVPPGVSGRYNSPSNWEIFSFNLALCAFCHQFDIPFLDAAYPLRDAQGDLPDLYCLNVDTGGFYLSDIGCQLWLQTVTDRLPD